ncbi:HlyD family type I secretion periplasmic adaptor subunit [Jannaschia aquimarina]|uniref:Membrane fusion protein (MFP) family protein n=1 Tax=Jannaschia aquimarina TaxID=935700 RepID=A0A0D1EJR5_9RHOB|nr:HlyD family type I secretion periplasmic adaptor subunit [Jannaschia aquimarina]KIT17236.1 Type I secretion system membrane fusion protein PrsE [Jannaschia aquimarina]SNT18898.1 type I secretion membrane fusion protein, HlyD family [Jannaschia aquimarina]
MTSKDPLTGRKSRHVPATARLTIRTVLLLLVGGVVWAANAELPEIAFASGTIQPTGALRRVEHIDGGVVDKILVEEGKLIGPQVPIVRLKEYDVAAEHDNLRARENVVRRSMIRNQKIFDAIGTDAFRPVDSQETDIRADARLRAYEATRRRISDRIAALDLRISAAEALIENVAHRETLQDREYAMIASLSGKGLLPERDHLAMQLRQSDLAATRLSAMSNLEEARGARRDAVNELLELLARTRDTVLGDIEQNSEELATINRAINDNRTRNDRLWVRSSIGGVVQSLYLNAPGEVIEPGGLVAEILPTGERLIAELRLKPRDIGHVEVGHRVEVRVTTYLAKRFGTLEGKVAQISATSAENELHEMYFRVRVDLGEELIGLDGTVHPLKAGMEVQASIVTGSRTVLEYAADPILRPFRGAFGDR